MKQRTRVFIAVGVIVLLSGLVLGVDLLRRHNTELPPGSVPIYQNGRIIASSVPEDLASLEKVSFVDDEEGKTQEGWLLRDVLALYLSLDGLGAETLITVSSSSREKSADLTWAAVNDPGNMVMFDLSGRGTLKLVSRSEVLATRDEWVQDVDRIEVR